MFRDTSDLFRKFILIFARKKLYIHDFDRIAKDVRCNVSTISSSQWMNSQNERLKKGKRKGEDRKRGEGYLKHGCSNTATGQIKGEDESIEREIPRIPPSFPSRKGIMHDYSIDRSSSSFRTRERRNRVFARKRKIPLKRERGEWRKATRS